VSFVVRCLGTLGAVHASTPTQAKVPRVPRVNLKQRSCHTAAGSNHLTFCFFTWPPCGIFFGLRWFGFWTFCVLGVHPFSPAAIRTRHALGGNRRGGAGTQCGASRSRSVAWRFSSVARIFFGFLAPGTCVRQSVGRTGHWTVVDSCGRLD
jgi:hypothetical protein